MRVPVACSICPNCDAQIPRHLVTNQPANRCWNDEPNKAGDHRPGRRATSNTGKPGVAKGRLRVAAGLSLILLIGVLLLPNGYKRRPAPTFPGACTTLSIKTVEHWAGKNIAAHRLQTDFLNSNPE